MKFNMLFKLFVFLASYGTVLFCNTEDLPIKENNNITISIPMNYKQLLQMLLDKDPNAKTLQINTASKASEDVDIQLMKALLKRNDINSEAIVKYIESGNNSDTNDINYFHHLLQFEQERFTKNLLNQDGYATSFIKQLYHAYGALTPYLVLYLAKFGYLAGSIYYLVIKTLFAPSALAFLEAIIVGIPLGTICLCFYHLFSNLDPSPNINSHWKQFNALDMLAKFTKIFNDGLLATAFIWMSYKLLANIISQRSLIESLQRRIAIASTHSLFEATLYAFLERLYDAGHLNNLGQPAEMFYPIHIPGV